MQFQVPQFIETEDKIIGPLTIKQFLFIAGAAGICFMLFYVVQFWLWTIMALIIISIGLAFAFVRINGQPLEKIFFSAIRFLIQPKLYLWQREAIVEEVTLPETKEIKEQREENVVAKRNSLKDFFSEMPDVKNLWRDLLTTKNPLPKREKINTPIGESTQKFELFRKLSGQKEIAKRVDYK